MALTVLDPLAAILLGIDVTFHGCLGVDWCDPEDADLDAVLFPVVRKQKDPWGSVPPPRLVRS